MRLGQAVHGYLITSKPTNANAGKCLWAFAEKDGEAFFVKEFLEPKRPRADSMGSPEDKRCRYAACQRFERRHERLLTLLRADDLYAGNLVLPVDFFADGTRYYKVTKRIDAATTVPHELAAGQQVVLLRTLADSLRLLHGHGIVHGDLKPENVLLHRPARSKFYTAKLIDFDDSYQTGQPPPVDTVGGSPEYAAPEWLDYVRGDAPGVRLTQATDMFAFGLLVHTYLFGALPHHDGLYESPAAAVADGTPLTWADGASEPLSALLAGLTSTDPAARPDITDTITALADPDLLGGFPATAERRSRVRINLTGRTLLTKGSANQS